MADHAHDEIGYLPGEVVELWWCPVCGGPAHRTWRPGRPKLYCSNACRQRAYRWRRDNHARTVARPGHPAASGLAFRGRWHAMRTDRDFVAHQHDRRHRYPTACGVLARPSRIHFKQPRGHYDFVPFSPDACRRCADLVRPPVDPNVPVEVRQLGPLHQRSRDDVVAWVRMFEPHHPIRRNPHVYAMLTGVRLPIAAAPP